MLPWAVESSPSQFLVLA